MSSSQSCSHRHSVQNGQIESSTALTATLFANISLLMSLGNFWETSGRPLFCSGDPFFFFLWVGVLIWIVVYDTFYALVDIDDDLKTGVFSTAILFGDKVSFVTSLSQITVLMAWAYLGIILEMSLLYFLMLIIVLLLFSRQQLLISDRQRKDCFKAFNESWYVGFFHFLGIFLSLS